MLPRSREKYFFHGYFVRQLSTFCQDAHPLKERLALVGERETFPRVLSTLLRIPGWGTTLLPSLNKPCRRGHVHVHKAEIQDANLTIYERTMRSWMLSYWLVTFHRFSRFDKYLPNPAKIKFPYQFSFHIDSPTIDLSWNDYPKWLWWLVITQVWMSTGSI